MANKIIPTCHGGNPEIDFKKVQELLEDDTEMDAEEFWNETRS